MRETPVYLFIGFLEGGKTKFINDTIAQGQFDDGEKTLLLICEEGVEEYDVEALAEKNIFAEVISDKAKLNPDKLEALQRKHGAVRVLCEYNGMWLIPDLFGALPDGWLVPQIMMFCDAETFLDYNANMRSLVVDKLNNTDLVVFNRFDPSFDKMKYHSIVRGVSRMCDIAYEYPNGDAEYDDIEDPLPYDIDAPVIEVGDKDFALWYRDVSEELDKYHGKTVCFKAQAAALRSFKDKMFAPGRFVMTCCEDDIQFCGLPCNLPAEKHPDSRDWVMVTAKISAEKHPIYHGDIGPVLTALTIIPAVPADPDVATF